MAQLRNLYLISYNFFQFLGWSFSLFRILSGLLSTQSVHGAYAAAGELICWLQTLAFLEVIHGAIGIVPSGVVLPLIQWGGRTHFLLAIVRRIHEVSMRMWCLLEGRISESHEAGSEYPVTTVYVSFIWMDTVQNLPSVFVTFFSWSLSEVIRYSHYVLNLSGSTSKWITLMRYNAFIFLYPIGVFPGEMWLIYKALPFIKKKKLYADHLPFSYYNFVVLLLFCYPFLWLRLYLHLFKQRRSKLGKSKRKKI